MVRLGSVYLNGDHTGARLRPPVTRASPSGTIQIGYPDDENDRLPTAGNRLAAPLRGGHESRPRYLVALCLDNYHFQPFSDGLLLALAVARRAVPRKQIRVLVVEDDEISARVARTILERFGCSVDIATNGKRAIEYFRDHAYDLVLMDGQMPVMDGIEATARIRSMPRGMVTPIIGTTAGTVRAECLAAGMNDVVPKPFVTEKLGSLLTRWTGWTMEEQPDSSE